MNITDIEFCHTSLTSLTVPNGGIQMSWKNPHITPEKTRFLGAVCLSITCFLFAPSPSLALGDGSTPASDQSEAGAATSSNTPTDLNKPKATNRSTDTNEPANVQKMTKTTQNLPQHKVSDGISSTANDPGQNATSRRARTEGLTASIGKRVWYDVNGNGVQDVGEPGAPNISVTLKDNLGSSVTNASGEEVGMATTDSTGHYEFANLAPGDYTVEFKLPAGTRASIDELSYYETWERHVSLAQGQTDDTANLGLVGVGSIGGKVWLDYDQNGYHDRYIELGLRDIPVTLVWAGPDGRFNTADDALAEVIKTSDDGTYISDKRLYPGKYRVSVDKSDITTTNLFTRGSEDNSLQTRSPDARHIGKSIIDLHAGGQFILSSEVTLTAKDLVMDSVYGDENRYHYSDMENYDQYFGFGKPIDLSLQMTIESHTPPGGYTPGSEVTYKLKVTNAGPERSSGVTVIDKLPNALTFVRAYDSYDGEKGLWNVKDLNPGESTEILVTARVLDTSEGTAIANTAEIATAEQKDVDSTPGNGKAGEDDIATVETSAGYELTGTLYHDVDGSFTRTPGEAAFAGVTVSLTDGDGAKIATTTTDAEGHYRFGSLRKGRYTITVTRSPEMRDMAVTGTYDKSRANTVRVKILDASVSSVDFGFVGTGSAGGKTWFDHNHNGIRDDGEPGVPGVRVTLLNSAGFPATADANGKAISPVTTGADGSYSFGQLLPGTYYVAFQTPMGMEATATGAGNDGSRDSNGTQAKVTVAEKQKDASIDLGLVGTGKIGGVIWFDSNRNGTLDPGEPGFPGIPVRVAWAGPDGKIGTADDDVRSATTKSDGTYRADKLLPGDYTVEIKAADVAASSQKVGDHIAANLQTFAPDGKHAGDRVIDTRSGGAFILSSKVTLNELKTSDGTQNFGFATASNQNSDSSSPAPKTTGRPMPKAEPSPSPERARTPAASSKTMPSATPSGMNSMRSPGVRPSPLAPTASADQGNVNYRNERTPSRPALAFTGLNVKFLGPLAIAALGFGIAITRRRDKKNPIG